MLSIARLTPPRVAYLEHKADDRGLDEAALDARREYYTERGSTLGEWFGGGAALLELEGEQVERGQLRRLAEGCDPHSGERLRRAVRTRHVVVEVVDPATGERVGATKVLEPVGGFDLTFGAPKSVSLAYALADARIRGELAAAHRAAVRAALGVLDREGCFVRLGRNGVRPERGGGIVAALFDHRLAREVAHPDGSRSVDPHLHTHCAVANLTTGPDGRWRTLSSRVLLVEYRRALGAVYQSVLRREVTARLGWSWAPQRANGLAELAGWSEPALRELSQRRRQVEHALVGMASTSARQPRPPRTPRAGRSRASATSTATAPTGGRGLPSTAWADASCAARCAPAEHGRTSRARAKSERSPNGSPAPTG